MADVTETTKPVDIKEIIAVLATWANKQEVTADDRAMFKLAYKIIEADHVKDDPQTTEKTWYPPETAPKDGSRFLGLCYDGEIYIYEHCYLSNSFQVAEGENGMWPWKDYAFRKWTPLPEKPQ